MRLWTPIFNITLALLLMLYLPYFYKMNILYQKQFDEQRLEYAVDFATKSAITKAIEGQDIELDYQTDDAVVLQLAQVKSEYENMICLNYEMQPDGYNRQIVENSIACMMINDEYGYYITELVQDSTEPTFDIEDRAESYILRWSLRVPYFYTTSDGRTATLTFSYMPFMEVTSSGAYSLTKTKIDFDEEETKNKVLKIINDDIQEGIEGSINRMNELTDDDFSYKFYLPYSTTVSGVNPISGPSLLVIMKSAPFASKYDVSAMSVGGYKIKTKEYISLVDYNGSKWYAYSSQVPTGMYKYITNIVGTQREAVDAGYTPNYLWMMNKRED